MYTFRYFYLCFDDTLTARITDVGVHVRTGDGTYLGAIHIHEGMKSANTLDCSINNVSLVIWFFFYRNRCIHTYLELKLSFFYCIQISKQDFK